MGHAPTFEVLVHLTWSDPNIVQLDLAETKIASQNNVNKVLELVKKLKNTQTSNINSNLFLEITRHSLF